MPKPTRKLTMRALACLKRTPLLALALSLLAGCQTDPSEPLEPRVVVVCGTVADYTKQQRARTADELSALSADSILASVLVPDLGRMRDEARACAKGQR
jgi:hypothetical protein